MNATAYSAAKISAALDAIKHGTRTPTTAQKALGVSASTFYRWRAKFKKAARDEAAFKATVASTGSEIEFDRKGEGKIVARKGQPPPPAPSTPSAPATTTIKIGTGVEQEQLPELLRAENGVLRRAITRLLFQSIGLTGSPPAGVTTINIADWVDDRLYPSVEVGASRANPSPRQASTVTAVPEAPTVLPELLSRLYTENGLLRRAFVKLSFEALGLKR